MSPAPYIPASVAETPEFQQLAADARRWRWFRRYLLRLAPAATASGSVLYQHVLETPQPIDAEELDRIIDSCQRLDAPGRTAFTHSGAGMDRLGGAALAPAAVTPPAEELVLEPEPETEPAATPKRAPRPLLEPMTCQCGAVRPPTRGRRPAKWSCGGCPV